MSLSCWFSTYSRYEVLKGSSQSFQVPCGSQGRPLITSGNTSCSVTYEKSQSSFRANGSHSPRLSTGSSERRYPRLLDAHRHHLRQTRIGVWGVVPWALISSSGERETPMYTIFLRGNNSACVLGTPASSTRSQAGRRVAHPFTAPAVSPCTMYLCR